MSFDELGASEFSLINFFSFKETCLGTHLCSAKNAAGEDVCYSDTQTCDNTAQCPDRQDESYCTGKNICIDATIVHYIFL